VRYWAGSGRAGVDTALSEDQMKVGRKLATKLLNVTKFVLGFGDGADDVAGDVAGGLATLDLAGAVTNPLDRSMLAKLDATITEATTSFDAFDYARALERTEAFFWWFCDDYVELVKGRAYNSQGDEQAASARLALHSALSAIQRLLAPILPFAAEESWSWWNEGSIHRAAWPVPTQVGGDPELIDPVVEVLTLVRRAKTEAKQSQRSTVESLIVSAPESMHAAIEQGRADLADAGSIATLELRVGESLSCATVLATTT